MQRRANIGSGKLILWGLLALPSLAMVHAVTLGGAGFDEMLHPTGEFSARLLIVALMLTPLAMIFPGKRWIAWLVRRRRAFGVAAFGYAALHLLFYLIDMGSLDYVLDELLALGIWTGWAAFAIMLPLALASNEAAMRRLRNRWKPLQRLAYLAALLTLVHWIFVHNNLGPALVHFTPLALLEAWRIRATIARRAPATPSTAGVAS